MRRQTIWGMSGLFLTIALAAVSFAGQYKVVGEKGDVYFGHISYVDTQKGGDAAVVFRWGATTFETAVLNLPLGPGDAVQTSGSGRCEIQFDNGTIVRLDRDTSLKIETVLAPSLSTAQKVTNLLVSRGAVYVMYKRHNSLEIFQVILPPAAVKLSDSAVALIEMAGGQASVQVERGRAEVLYGSGEDDVAQKKVNGGERIVVDASNIARPAEYAAVSEFMSWNGKVNADFLALHEGNVLPKPLQNLPPAVFEFAQKFGNVHGEWVWHDLYGYVWRPYLNDLRYPWGTWQPYYYGNWSSYNGQLYWVPGEPWGWVPYHLGLWMWDENLGWVWMPGSLFAPAWVAWEFYSGHYFWRPFSLFDYYEEWEGYPYLWGLVNWDDDPGAFDGTRPDYPARAVPVRSVVTKDGLKKKTQPPFPVPREMKGALRAAADALSRGDARAQSSLRETMRRAVIVSKTDFGRPGWQEKRLSLDRFLERPGVRESGPKPSAGAPSEFIARDALRRYESARAADFRFVRELPAGRGEAMIHGSGRPGAVIQDRGEGDGRPASSVAGPGQISRGEVRGSSGLSQPGIRFRDWNPDVKAAVRMGVDISYSSRTNEVYSSRLGLRSGDDSPRSRMWRSGGFSEGFSSDPGTGMGPAGGPPSTVGQAGPGPNHSVNTSVSRDSLRDSSGEKVN